MSRTRKFHLKEPCLRFPGGWHRSGKLRPALSCRKCCVMVQGIKSPEGRKPRFSEACARAELGSKGPSARMCFNQESKRAASWSRTQRGCRTRRAKRLQISWQMTLARTLVFGLRHDWQAWLRLQLQASHALPAGCSQARVMKRKFPCIRRHRFGLKGGQGLAPLNHNECDFW